MLLFLRRCIVFPLYCGSAVLFSSCLDLNDFNKISKNVELEVSLPFYQSTVYMDTFVTNHAKRLKVGNSGVYYIESVGDSNTQVLNGYEFDYSFNFSDTKLGPFVLLNDRIDFQTKLYDYGFAKTTIDKPIAITSIVPQSNKYQLKKIHVKKGNLIIDIINEFDKEVDIKLELQGLQQPDGTTFSNTSITVSPNDSLHILVPLNSYTVSLNVGDAGFNQLFMRTEITVQDPAAQGNAASAIIGSFSNLVIKTRMDIDSVYSSVGSLPSHSLGNFSLKMPVAALDLKNIFKPEYADDIDILNSVVAMSIDSKIKSPLAAKITNVTAGFITNTTTPIPSKNPDVFNELSYPAFLEGLSPVQNKLIVDDHLVEESLLRNVLYDQDLDNFSMDLNLVVSPVKATLNDELTSPSSFTYYLSLFAPMRLDVNNLKIRELSFDNSSLIKELDNIISTVGRKVSKVILSSTLENYMPFDILPQYYVYKNSQIIDSLISTEDGIPYVSGAPVDNNGLMLEGNVAPKTFLMELDKSRWEKIKQSDALFFSVKVNSVKSAKIPYVILANSQRLKFSLKARKIIFSVSP